MKLAQAQDIAEKYLNLLRPHCLRIEIAGSIRREKLDVKDIEIVCIPQDVAGFVAQVKQWPKVRGEPTGKYTQRNLPEGIKLDLFMAEERNWGNILLIRTGPADFSKWIMGTKVRKAGFRQKDGYLQKGGQIIVCREERDLFKLIGMNYVEPKYRIAKYS